MEPDYNVYGSGPAFVYVPGIEGTGRLFYKQIDDLARDHTVITVPLRSHHRYEMPVLIEDLRTVVRSAGFERATVLGESFGGLLTMATALAHPELFERMILLNTFPFFTQRAKISLGCTLFSIMPERLMKAYRNRSTRRSIFGSDVTEDDRRLFRQHTRTVARAGYVSRMRIIRDTDLRPRLEEIKVPALVVAGTDDRLFDSLSAATLITRRLARAKLLILKGAGHTALLSDRVRVREWLAEFEDF